MCRYAPCCLLLPVRLSAVTRLCLIIEALICTCWDFSEVGRSARTDSSLFLDHCMSNQLHELLGESQWLRGEVFLFASHFSFLLSHVLVTYTRSPDIGWLKGVYAQESLAPALMRCLDAEGKVPARGTKSQQAKLSIQPARTSSQTEWLACVIAPTKTLLSSLWRHLDATQCPPTRQSSTSKNLRCLSVKVWIPSRNNIFN